MISFPLHARDAAKTHRINLKQLILQELNQVLKLELHNLVLGPFEDGDREAKDGFHSFGEDEVEDGRDELEGEAVSVGAFHFVCKC